MHLGDTEADDGDLACEIISFVDHSQRIGHLGWKLGVRNRELARMPSTPLTGGLKPKEGIFGAPKEPETR